MATITHRLHRRNTDATYDTWHLETESGVVLRPNGDTVEQTLTKCVTATDVSSGSGGFKMNADTLNGKTAAEIITEASGGSGSGSTDAGIPIVATQGSSTAYTATVDGVTTLTVGMIITIVPHATCSVVAPTLDVNSTGAKKIMRVGNTTYTIECYESTLPRWIAAGVPLTLQYNGAYWVAIAHPVTRATDIRGTIPLSSGGLGGTTAAEGRATLDVYSKSEVDSAISTGGGSGSADPFVAGDIIYTYDWSRLYDSTGNTSKWMVCDGSSLNGYVAPGLMSLDGIIQGRAVAALSPTNQKIKVSHIPHNGTQWAVVGVFDGADPIDYNFGFNETTVRAVYFHPFDKEFINLDSLAESYVTSTNNTPVVSKYLGAYLCHISTTTNASFATAKNINFRGRNAARTNYGDQVVYTPTSDADVLTPVDMAIGGGTITIVANKGDASSVGEIHVFTSTSYSSDTPTWAHQIISASSDVVTSVGIEYVNGKWVIAANTGTTNIVSIYTATDPAATWTKTSAGLYPITAVGISYHNGLFAVCGTDPETTGEGGDYDIWAAVTDDPAGIWAIQYVTSDVVLSKFVFDHDTLYLFGNVDATTPIEKFGMFKCGGIAAAYANKYANPSDASQLRFRVDPRLQVGISFAGTLTINDAGVGQYGTCIIAGTVPEGATFNTGFSTTDENGVTTGKTVTGCDILMTIAPVLPDLVNYDDDSAPIPIIKVAN